MECVTEYIKHRVWIEAGKYSSKGEGWQNLLGGMGWGLKQLPPQRPPQCSPKAGRAEQVGVAAHPTPNPSPSAFNYVTYLASENGFI